MKYSIKIKQSLDGKVTSYMAPQKEKLVYEMAIEHLEKRGMEVYGKRIVNTTEYTYMRKKN